MKHKDREATKKKRKRIGLVLAVAILIVIISYSMLSSPSEKQEASEPSRLNAAIVDHLSLTVPNQTFLDTTTELLEEAGFAVDYYPGEEVTVNFYRILPTHGYNLVILRVHSSATDPEGKEASVTLFTSEPFSATRYALEQLNDHLAIVGYFSEESGSGMYFGICPSFVAKSMIGSFQNTVVIMMGCEGLANPSMAEAFIQRGANVYVSWNGPVTASYTDSATTQLLKHFLIEKLTLKESVRKTYQKAGYDPACPLCCYPLEAGEETIEAMTGNFTKKP